MSPNRSPIAILAFAALLAACGGDESTPAGTESGLGLVEVARPDVEGLEPLERSLLVVSREVVDDLRARPDAPREALARAYGELGRTYHAYGFHAAARDAYRNAQIADPGAFEWPYYLGHVQRELGEAGAARAAFGRALEIRPGDPAAAAALAALDGAPASGEGADPLIQALAERRTATYAGLVVGEAAMTRKDFAAAAEAFRSAVEAAPDDPRPWQSLGAALFRAGDAAGAIAAFREVLERNPDDAVARFNLGALLAQGGDDEAAVAEYRLALETNPDDARVRFNLGNSLRRLERFDEAAAAFRWLVEKRPDEEVVRLAEVVCLVEGGRGTDAVARLEQGLAAMPTSSVLADAAARLAAASPDASIRDGDRALALAERLASRQPTVRHLETLAMALAETGQMGRAIATQRRSIAGAEREGQVELLERLRENLAGYERGEPCRDPALG